MWREWAELSTVVGCCATGENTTAHVRALQWKTTSGVQPLLAWSQLLTAMRRVYSRSTMQSIRTSALYLKYQHFTVRTRRNSTSWACLYCVHYLFTHRCTINTLSVLSAGRYNCKCCAHIDNEELSAGVCGWGWRTEIWLTAGFPVHFLDSVLQTPVNKDSTLTRLTRQCAVGWCARIVYNVLWC